MIYRFLNRRFEAAGSAYPLRATLAILIGGHLIVLLGVLLLDIQLSFTTRELVVIVIIAEILMGIDNLISAILLGPGEHPTIARDSVMAVSMIILNLVVGVAFMAVGFTYATKWE